MEQCDMMGEGTCGFVYKARHRLSGDTMKKFCLEQTQADEGENTALRENSLLKELHHVHIVRCVATLGPAVGSIQPF
jgi:hypothetical protein